MNAKNLKPYYHQLNAEQKRILRESFLKEFHPKCGVTYFYKAMNREMTAEQYIWLLIRLNLLKAQTISELKHQIPSAKVKRAIPVSIQYKDILKARKQQTLQKSGLHFHGVN